MFKNTASQKISVFAFDTTTGLPKTGDAANIAVYINKDWAGVNQLTDTSASEIDNTNAKGWYLFDVSQTETNADALHFTGKSTTANISVVGQLIFTRPANFTKLVIDSAGLADANAVKVGPTGSGTAQTARDIGASVLLSSGTGTGQLDFTSGVVKSNLAQILGTALTETAGLLAGGFKKFFNVATPTGTVNSLPDAVAGATGGLFIAGTNAATTVTTSFTSTFTGNLTGNVGGNVTGSIGSLATQAKADVNAEADTALADYDAPTHTELTAELATADDAVLAQVALVRSKTDNLPSDPADASDIAAAFGVVGSALSGLNDLSEADVRTAVGLASANLDTQLGALASQASVDDVKAVTDKVSDTLEDDAGTFRFTANALEEAPSGGGTAPTVDEIADEVETRTLAAVAGLALAADLATTDGKIDAVKDQTDKLIFDGDSYVASDARKISTSAMAADNLEAGAKALVVSSAAAGSTTLAVETNLTESTDDHYNGRVITFIDGDLAGQSTNITDYNGTTKTLAVTALTEPPGDTDAFVIS